MTHMTRQDQPSSSTAFSLTSLPPLSPSDSSKEHASVTIIATATNGQVGTEDNAQRAVDMKVALAGDAPLVEKSHSFSQSQSTHAQDSSDDFNGLHRNVKVAKVAKSPSSSFSLPSSTLRASSFTSASNSIPATTVVSAANRPSSLTSSSSLPTSPFLAPSLATPSPALIAHSPHSFAPSPPPPSFPSSSANSPAISTAQQPVPKAASARLPTILSHSPSQTHTHSLSRSVNFPQSHRTNALAAKPASLFPNALASTNVEPSFAFHKALLLGLNSSPLRFALSVRLVYFCSPLDLYLDDFRYLSFQSLIAAYTLPLLWIFAPGLGLLLSIFQVFSLLAAGTTSFSADLELRPKKMDPHSSLSASSSSPPSSSSQNQLRHDPTSVHHRVSMPDNAGTLILHHNHTPANHHHHDQNNTAGGSSRSRLPANSPHQPYIFSASHQGQDSTLAPLLNHSHNHGGRNHGFDQLPHEYDGDEALDGDEDRQSDEGSEGEPGFNEMEFWQQRCSICFDARLDFCLEYCRDQFCRDCFQRYVKEVVSNSWGLNVTKIKCPVCQDVISLSEWTQYVDQSTLAQYQQYNQPYRSFSRFCNDCEHELVISEVNPAVIGLPVRDLAPIFDRISVDLKALLILGGMNLADPITASSSLSSPSSNLPHTKHKRRSSHSKRDILAHEIVQKFANDYQFYCGVSQEVQVSLPSKAQSHFSNLAFRTFGGPFTQLSSPPPIIDQRLSTPAQAQQQPVALPIPSSTQQPQPPQPRTNSHSAQDLISNHPLSAIFQRRQHTSRSIGVLEIYKSLMTSLLDLFDLNRKDREDTTEKSIRIDKRTGETEKSETSQVILSLGAAMQDLTSGSEGGEIEMVDITERPPPPGEAENGSTSTDSTNLKRKGPPDSMSRRPKRTRPGRSGMTTRAESKRQVEIKKALVRLGKQLSSIETRPEQWKELQFLHVRWLRWDWCNHCDQELCLQCGVASHHESQNCSDYMRSLIAGNHEASSSQKGRSAKTEESPPSRKNTFSSTTSLKGKGRSELDTHTIQWKLANTNPCPNCCILIHRDDGCNKVDCMLCGHRFCWICRESWGAACGFFKCGRRPAAIDLPHADGMDDSRDVSRGEGQIQSLDVSQHFTGDSGQGQAGTGASPQNQRRNQSDNAAGVISEMPEIGVPNVFVIHTKRSRA